MQFVSFVSRFLPFVPNLPFVTFEPAQICAAFDFNSCRFGCLPGGRTSRNVGGKRVVFVSVLISFFFFLVLFSHDSGSHPLSKT